MLKQLFMQLLIDKIMGVNFCFLWVTNETVVGFNKYLKSKSVLI